VEADPADAERWTARMRAEVDGLLDSPQSEIGINR
jgi:hypothetical protein